MDSAIFQPITCLCSQQMLEVGPIAQKKEDKDESDDEIADLDQLLRKEREKERKREATTGTESEQVMYICSRTYIN